MDTEETLSYDVQNLSEELHGSYYVRIMLEDLKGGTSEFEFFSNKTLTENESYDDQEDTKDNVANVD